MTVIRDAFGFPLRGKGRSLLIVGGILGIFVDFALLAGILGFFAVIFLFGYMSGIYFQIIQTTAVGQEDAPEYPEMSNIMEDLVFPFLQVLFVGVISFAPATIYIVMTGQGGVVSLLLVGVGIAYFPMAMLAVVVLGDTWAVRPTLVIPSIFRTGRFYLLVMAMLVILYVLEYFVLEFFGGTLIVGSLVAAFVGMYTMMVNGRILGAVYRENEEELGWL